MTGKASREKGSRGQYKARKILEARDYRVDVKSCGLASEDLLATCPNGTLWSVEVKNTKNLTLAHVEQARRQGKERGLPWMLMQHLHGSSSWLVRRQGMRAVVWHENGDI